MIQEKISGSFRDPSGFIFVRDKIIYRQINQVYKENYDFFIESGLYKKLVGENLLIPHVEVIDEPIKLRGYKVIKPQLVPFISYPYEWSFSQLKNAALTTLKIQKISMEYGMSLKDCSAFNIQFLNGKCIFIDTLSFEKYIDGKPWVAYQQFCQHFLAPLALMSNKDIRLNQLLRIYLDGIPLDLASSLLPSTSLLKFSSLSHIHLHAKSQKHFGQKKIKKAEHKLSRSKLLALLVSLESAVNGMKWKPQDTEWTDYYNDTNYSQKALEQKKQMVDKFLEEIRPKTVWDLGANTGLFSRIASNKGIQTISFDIDPSAVEKNYLESVKNDEVNILPLLLDLSNPSSSLGWANEERMSIFERDNPDTILALALIHHLAITNNLPFEKIAELFSKICNSLIIEFVPKNDSQVQRLLVTREDVFSDYTQKDFEVEFSKYFKIEKSKIIKNTERTLYLMRKKLEFSSNL